MHGLGDAIVLTGTVSSETRKAQALQVARLLIGDAEMSDLMTVEATQDCVIRTRRGGEVIETRIPCRN